MELIPLNKEFPAKDQGIQLLKMMEMVSFSSSLDIPLLGVSLSVNYSHISNGVKSLRLSRANFNALIHAVENMPYSPDAMVLQIQAVFLEILNLNLYIFPQGAYDNASARTQDLEAALGSNYHTRDQFAVSVEDVTSKTLNIMAKILTTHESLMLIR